MNNRPEGLPSVTIVCNGIITVHARHMKSGIHLPPEAIGSDCTFQASIGPLRGAMVWRKQSAGASGRSVYGLTPVLEHAMHADCTVTTFMSGGDVDGLCVESNGDFF